MPRHWRWVGTGLTRRKEYSLDVSNLEDLQALLDDPTVLWDVESQLTHTEASAIAILTKAGLPGHCRHVRVFPDGRWSDDLDPDGRSTLRRGEAAFTVLTLTERDPRWGFDTLEWYAAKILDTIRQARLTVAHGHAQQALFLGFLLGDLVATCNWKFNYEHFALRGIRNLATLSMSGKQRAARYGERDREIIKQGVDYLQKHPKASISAAALHVMNNWPFPGDAPRHSRMRRIIGDHLRKTRGSSH